MRVCQREREREIKERMYVCMINEKNNEQYLNMNVENYIALIGVSLSFSLISLSLSL
jgi:hypothetical protein